MVEVWWARREKRGFLHAYHTIPNLQPAYFAVRAILALSDRVQQNSIEGALQLETENLIESGL